MGSCTLLVMGSWQRLGYINKSKTTKTEIVIKSQPKNRPFQSEFPCASYENDLHESEPELNVHMNGFTLRLVLTRRRKETQKWPIK